jgi:hypothetical protein
MERRTGLMEALADGPSFRKACALGQYVLILVAIDVSGRRNLAPRHLWMPRLELIGQPSRCR